MSNKPIPVELPSNLSEDEVQNLAHGLGLTIPDTDLKDVSARFTALMSELNKIRSLDLSQIAPTPIFPYEKGECK